MFTNIIKEACKNTKNCKCCFNVQPPFRLPQQSRTQTLAQTTVEVHKQLIQHNRIRPFYMS